MPRIVILRVAVLLVIAVLIGRLYQLQLGPGDTQNTASNVELALNRRVFVRPLRGEIFAADGKTRLAESRATYALAVRPGDLPPATSPRRQEMFARLSQLTGLTSTLTLEHASALAQRPRPARRPRVAVRRCRPRPPAQSLGATAPFTFTEPAARANACRLHSYAHLQRRAAAQRPHLPYRRSQHRAPLRNSDGEE